MITSITAVFHDPGMGGRAVDRIRSGVPGVYSASLRTHGGIASHRGSSVIPAFANNFSMNFMTAVMDSPEAAAGSDLSGSAKAYIVCDGSHISEITGILNTLGAVSIRVNQPSM